MSSSLSFTTKEQAIASKVYQPDTFHVFRKFPPEVQQMIWGFAAREGRHVSIRIVEEKKSAAETNNADGTDIDFFRFRSVDAIPQMMHVCSQARFISMKYHQLAFGVEKQFPELAHQPYTACQIYLNPASDVLCPMPRWKALPQQLLVEMIRDLKVEKVALSDYSFVQRQRGRSDAWGGYQGSSTGATVQPGVLNWMTEHIRVITLWTQSKIVIPSESIELIAYETCIPPIDMPKRQLECSNRSLKCMSLSIDVLKKAQNDQKTANKEADKHGKNRERISRCPHWLYEAVDTWKPPKIKHMWHMSKDLKPGYLSKVVTDFVGGHASALIRSIKVPFAEKK
ncbi:hypothetical protein EYC80_010196 [Monilinia laxa]|uniref:2EXR domain-containing protein n=1 Tax=Monilinia laxa TaxID=61186 RepID=A0A5N6JPS4_MONLA|nr:hypothetical protein EYC80_010196 [Monilinia laxa]